MLLYVGAVALGYPELAVLATGCAHEYAYLPVDAAGGGGPVARYPIPPEAPRGEVREAPVADDELQALRQPRLAGEGRAARALVRGQRRNRAIA